MKNEEFSLLGSGPTLETGWAHSLRSRCCAGLDPIQGGFPLDPWSNG